MVSTFSFLGFLLTSPIANASTKDFRMGLCVGIEHTCGLIGLNFQYTTPKFGVRLGVGPVTQGAQFNAYFKDKDHKFRPYYLLGTGLMSVPDSKGVQRGVLAGTGFGFDLHFGAKRKMIYNLQLAAEYEYLLSDAKGHLIPYPLGSMSLIWKFGKK